MRASFALFALPFLCFSALAADDGRPMEKEPFPAVEDWSSVHIRLERGTCPEACPVYSVEIDGDGTVTYLGEDNVLMRGRRTAQIGKEKVRELVKKFQKAEFFWTFTFYEGPSEAPTDRLSLSFDSREHAVADQGGFLPKPVAALFEAVDKAAGSEKWAFGEPPKGSPPHGKTEDKPATKAKPAAKQNAAPPTKGPRSGQNDGLD